MQKKGKANDIDKHVGQKLKQFRIASNKTQEEVAEALGMTFQQVQKYERGTDRISVGNLFVLANFFKVPIADFYDRKVDHKNPQNKDELKLLEHYRALKTISGRKMVLDMMVNLRAVEAAAQFPHIKES